MTLSEKLQNLRRAAGLSQEQLAEQLGVTRQAVSKWETGEGKPDIDNLLPLAKLLGTTVDYLLDDGADEPRTETPPHTQPQSQSVGRELWEQLKAFGRRWGWLGGYAIALIGAVRFVTTAFILFAGGTALGGIFALDFDVAVTGFGLAYYAVGLIQLAVYLAMIVGGIWLARWLKRKYAE